MKNYQTISRLERNALITFLRDNKIPFTTSNEHLDYTIYWITVLDRTEEVDEWIKHCCTL
jgi:hypothetical protein